MSKALLFSALGIAVGFVIADLFNYRFAKHHGDVKRAGLFTVNAPKAGIQP